MPNSYVKQLQIGNDNYNIKAEKAASQNSDAAVVRDIQYGTNAPSGGESGQLYLQYDASSSTNSYVYAEDTAANPTSVVDAYYSKSEVDTNFTTLQNYIDNKLNWKRLASVTGNNNYDVTSIWDQATEFCLIVSKYYLSTSTTTANPVFELPCYAIKRQIEEDWTSSYNTGKVVYVPTETRYNTNSGASHTWSALFRFHNGNGSKYVQLNELFPGNLSSANQASNGYYVIYWR